MAKQHRIVKSEDATTIIAEGDRRNQEPTNVIVKFPGGFIEVARTSDDGYWAHIGTVRRNDGEQVCTIVDSRVDYVYEKAERGIPQLPEMDGIDKIAVKFEARR